MAIPLIIPDWPAPPGVKALSSTRNGGVSLRPWDTLNLGDHVGDDPAAVAQNRAAVAALTGLDGRQVHWLEQVHGERVLTLPLIEGRRCADAATTSRPGEICAILTADCLPVLFCNQKGTQVAVAHAGWRGLLAGVLENTVARFEEPESVMAWLGPAIGPESFEVGPEVREGFVQCNAESETCFVHSPHSRHRYLADIYGLARQRLRASGVVQINGGERCTVQESGTFFSFRRDGQTGRQASFVWLEASPE